MPIGFARMQLLSRSAGHDARQRYRYIARLGEYARRADLALGPVCLVPEGTPPSLEGADLWNAVERHAPRKDSIVGAELVLALPLFSQLSRFNADRLVAEFCEALIVSHNLGASYAIHGVHDDQSASSESELASEDGAGPSVVELIETVSSWPHAHVLITPRTLGPHGLSPRRCSVLEPLIRGTTKTRTVLCAVPWVKIWTRYLNAALARAGSVERVRLKAPHGGPHIGPARALAVFQGDIDRGEAPETQMWPRLNLQIEERNVQTLTTAPELAETVFTRPEVADLLSRYLDPSGPALAERTERFLQEIEAVALPDPLTGAPTRWYSSRATLERARRIVILAGVLAGQPRRPMRSQIAQIVDRLERDADLALPMADLLDGGHRLVTIEAGDLGSLLPALDEIARHAAAQPIHIGHQAMTLAAMGRRSSQFLIPTQLEKKLKPGSVIVLDRPDALPFEAFETLLELAQKRGCQLLLVRRPHSLVFPRNVVLDRVAAKGLTHSLPASREGLLPSRVAPADRELAGLFEILVRGHARVLPTHAARLDRARRIVNHPRPTRFIALNSEDRARLGLPESEPLEGHAGVEQADRVDEVAVLLPHADRTGPLYCHCSPQRTAILIDGTQTPTLAHLIAQTALAAGDDRLCLAAALGDGEGSTRTGSFDAHAEIAILYHHHLLKLAAEVGPPSSIHPNLAKLLTMPIAELLARFVRTRALSEPGPAPEWMTAADEFSADDDPRLDDPQPDDQFDIDDDPSFEPDEDHDSHRDEEDDLDDGVAPDADGDHNEY